MNDVWEDWKLYERLVARMMADQLSTEFCVTPNASIRGAITEYSAGSPSTFLLISMLGFPRR